MNNAMDRIEEIMLPNKIADEINQILARHKIKEQISASDFILGETLISDAFRHSSTLSDLISQSIWPSIPKASVYHYTSREAAENILNTQTFWLTNIGSRKYEGEILEFCKDNDLIGMFEMDENNRPFYETIMASVYYASFTDTNLTVDEEEYFWRNFAQNDGVRLKLEIEASNINFRKIHYPKKPGTPIPVLREISNTLRDKYARKFLLKSISTLCAFSLPNEYKKEKEYRMLYRVFEGSEYTAIGTGDKSYFELPLDTPRIGYGLKVVEVHARERPDMPGHHVFSKRGD